MNNVILFVLIAIAALVILALIAKCSRLNHAKSSLTQTQLYEIGRPLLSAAEKSFFHVLSLAAEDFLIFVKVRLADIVTPRKTGSRSAWQSSFAKISQKHVDFVICSKTDVAVAAVVELDDRSHSSLDRGFRDAFVNEALTSAGIPIIRVRAQQSYSVEELRTSLQQVTGRSVPTSRMSISGQGAMKMIRPTERKTRN